jgi:hypothetical protein
MGETGQGQQVLHHLGPELAGLRSGDGLAVGDSYIEPVPRPPAVTGYDEELWPVLRREPLNLGASLTRTP